MYCNDTVERGKRRDWAFLVVCVRTFCPVRLNEFPRNDININCSSSPKLTYLPTVGIAKYVSMAQENLCIRVGIPILRTQKKCAGENVMIYSMHDLCMFVIN